MDTGRQWRSACISLDGLLDYDEGDKEEPTLELSLFAEALQDMLMRDSGMRILSRLQAERWVSNVQHIHIQRQSQSTLESMNDEAAPSMSSLKVITVSRSLVQA